MLVVRLSSNDQGWLIRHKYVQIILFVIPRILLFATTITLAPYHDDEVTGKKKTYPYKNVPKAYHHV